ncbi:hypothetical protein ABK040_013044 [Willaertia magna]
MMQNKLLSSPSTDALSNMEEFSIEDLPEVNWEPYQEAGVLTPLEKQRMEDINIHNHEVKDIISTILNTGVNEYIQLFIKLLYNIHQNETLTNILYLIEVLFTENLNILKQFHDIIDLNNNNPYTPFLMLLNKNDLFILEKVYSCLSKLFELDADRENRSNLFTSQEEIEALKKIQSSSLVGGNSLVGQGLGNSLGANVSAVAVGNKKGSGNNSGLVGNEMETCLEAISNQLNTSGDDVRKARMCLKALMKLLKRNDCRGLYFKARGIPPLINLLRIHRNNIQILYEVSFCLWLLTFHENVVTFFQNEYLVPRLHDVLKNSQKEKVIRIILFTFKNLMKHSKFITSMINVSVPKTLINLQKRSFEDKDITEDVNNLANALETHIEEISSFDEYRQEVLSGHLEWTPVHSSEKFWKENLDNFETNNFYILKELIKLLDDETNVDNLAIACHDVGEFVRYHNRGKRIVTDLGGKARIIQLMEHPNDEVKKHALQCCQKIMIKNWEFIK